jgi:hypothetical protein
MGQRPVSMTMTGRKAPAGPLVRRGYFGPDLRRSTARETSGHCAAPGWMVMAPAGEVGLGRDGVSLSSEATLAGSARLTPSLWTSRNAGDVDVRKCVSLSSRSHGGLTGQGRRRVRPVYGARFRGPALRERAHSGFARAALGNGIRGHARRQENRMPFATLSSAAARLRPTRRILQHQRAHGWARMPRLTAGRR